MLKDLLKKFHLVASTVETSAALLNPAERHPIRMMRGQGSLLTDDEGREYIDATASLSGNVLGHCHHKISEAVSLQASKLLTISNHYHSQEEDEFAEKFCQISGLHKVDISSSSEQALATALLFATYHAKTKGEAADTILSTKQKFHTIKSTPNLNDSNDGHSQNDFEIIQAPFGDLDTLAQIGDENGVVALLIEPISWENPLLLDTDDYLQTLRHYCDEQDWLLIVDESDMGIASKGSWMRYQSADISPDILLGPTALANNLGIGICAINEKVATLVEPHHKPEQRSSALACQVALSIIEEVEQEELISRALETAEYLKRQIQQRICTLDSVQEIRANGLMQTVVLNKSYAGLDEKFLASGLVVDLNSDQSLIRLYPALTLEQSQAKQIAQIIHNVLLTL